MPNLIDELCADAKAQGAREATRAMLAAIRHLVEQGRMTRGQARSQIDVLAALGVLSEDAAREALAAHPAGDSPSLTGLITACAREGVELLDPDLITAFGPPAEAAPMPEHDLAHLDLVDGHRCCDLALRCIWPDGRVVIVMLIERWPRSPEFEPDRAVWSLMGLRLRERWASGRSAEVIPVVWVADPAAGAVPDHWCSAPFGERVLDFRMRVVRLQDEDARRLEGWRQRMAALLVARCLCGQRRHPPEAMAALVDALEAQLAASGIREDLWRCVSLIERLHGATAAAHA